MQWLSIYGYSKSSLSEILLDSRERCVGLLLCHWLVVRVRLIKLPQGWDLCGISLSGLDALMGWRHRVLQHLATKVLRQHFFLHPGLILWLFLSYLYCPYCFSFCCHLLSPFVLRDLPRFQHFQSFVPFCFKPLAQWMLNKTHFCTNTQWGTILSLHLSAFCDNLSFTGCSVFGCCPPARASA